MTAASTSRLPVSGTADVVSESSERFNRGLQTMRELDGDLADRLQASLTDVAPGFAESLVEFAFGEIYTRPGLDLRTRELATVAALTVLGTAPAQLKLHVAAALNVGCSRQEVAEVVVQMAVYAGVPAALNGLAAVKEAFAGHPASMDAAAGGSSIPELRASARSKLSNTSLGTGRRERD